MKRGHLIRWVAALAVVGLAAFLLRPKNHLISQELDMIEYKNEDPGYSRPVHVHLYGTYRESLFGEDEFFGGIKLDVYPVTLERHALAKIDGADGGDLYYVDTTVQGMDGRFSPGLLFCTPEMEKFVLLYNKELLKDPPEPGAGYGWSSGSWSFLAHPAQSREEAVERANEVLRRSADMGDVRIS